MAMACVDQQRDVLTLRPIPLTTEAFAPYGDIIEMTGEPLQINYGRTDRFHDLANIDPGQDGKAIVSIFRSLPIMLPFMIKVMENHPLGTQAFVPLDNRPYLVVVAPAGRFDPADLAAFCVRGDQGVNYHKGVWHHYSLALQDESRFLVIDRSGTGHNLEETHLRCSVTILAGDGTSCA